MLTCWTDVKIISSSDAVQQFKGLLFLFDQLIESFISEKYFQWCALTTSQRIRAKTHHSQL